MTKERLRQDLVRKGSVLLTGGRGRAGREIARTIGDGGWEVRHFSRSDPDDGNAWVPGDVLDAAALAEATTGCDVVVHAAALHGRAWREVGDQHAFRVNVEGTLNVLLAAAAAGVNRVVFTSSIWATGHGPNPPYLPIDEELPREPSELYGLTKLLGEGMSRNIAVRLGVSTICLRVGWILPAAAWKPARLDYLVGAVDVRDVAQAHLLAIQAPPDLRHEVCVITADSPLQRITHDQFRADPVASIRRVEPSIGALVEAGDIDLSPSAEYYSIERARRVLGYRPRYGFAV